MTATNTSRRPADMTSAADERGAEALRKFRILLSASFVSSLIVFGSDILAVSLPSIWRSLKASFAVVQRVISAYGLILISERETASMRAEAPAKMPCNRSTAATRSHRPAKRPLQNLKGKRDDQFERR
jgi:hypothetical protein